MWYVYILKCNDGSYYTGISADIERRIKQHNDGKGSRYTKLRRPLVLVYAEKYQCKHDAEKREVEIKKFGVKGKERLIKYGNNSWFPSGQNRE
ncbi:MAG: GIY-YIG nuclease family protein [Candidatus Omnitrophica bacterium]|nr:GIY-YIG nuclease family protein [Candidatus Omnitrophota bacterium]